MARRGADVPLYTAGRRRAIVLLLLTSILLITLDLRGNAVFDAARSGLRRRDGAARDGGRRRHPPGPQRVARDHPVRRGRARRTTGCASSSTPSAPTRSPPRPRSRSTRSCSALSDLPVAGDYPTHDAPGRSGRARATSTRSSRSTRAATTASRSAWPWSAPPGWSARSPRRCCRPGLVMLVTDSQYQRPVKVIAGASTRRPRPPTTDDRADRGSPSRRRPTTTSTTDHDHASPPDDDRAADDDRCRARRQHHDVRRRRPPRRRSPDRRSRARPASSTGAAPTACRRSSCIDDTPTLGRVAVGDLVFTAGGNDSLAPPDIPIGVVAQRDPRAGAEGPLLEIELSADLDRLHFVDSSCSASRESRDDADDGGAATDVRVARPGAAAAAVPRRGRRAGAAGDAVRRPAPGRHQRAGRARPRRGGRRGRRSAEGRAGRVRARVDVRPRTSARRSARRRSRWASPGSSPATSRRSRSTRRGGWRRCSARSARRPARRPCRWCGRSSARTTRSAPTTPSSSRRSRSAAAVLSPLLVPVGRWCMRVKRAGVEGAAEDVSMTRQLAPRGRPRDALRRPDCAMAADKRAARLGVLGARRDCCSSGRSAPGCGSCRRCRPTSLQQVVDARKTKTVRLAARAGPHLRRRRSHPRRQRARCSRVAVDWDVIRRATDRAELFSRLSGWVGVPVEEMEARYDGERLQPLQADAGRRRTSTRTSPSPIRSAARTSPASRSRRSWKRVYPYAPLASHVVGYMGAITAEDEATRYVDAGLRHVARRRGRRSGRRRAVMEEVLHGTVGRGRLRGRRRQPASCARSADPSRSTAWTSSCRSTSTSSSTPSGCCRPSCGSRGAAPAPNPEVTKPDGTRRTARPEPRRRHVRPLQGAGRLGDGDELPDRPDRGDGQLPDVRQPLVLGRHRRREVRGDLPDHGTRRRHAVDPDRATARQPGDPGPVQPRLDVQGVHRLRRPRHRPDRPGDDVQRPGTYELQSIDPSRQVRAGRSAACSATRSARRSTARAGTARSTSMQSLAVSSDAFYYKLGEDVLQHAGHRSCRTRSGCSASAPTPGIDLPFEFDGRVPDQRAQAAARRERRARRGRGRHACSRATCC